MNKPICGVLLQMYSIEQLLHPHLCSTTLPFSLMKTESSCYSKLLPRTIQLSYPLAQ
ncbi:hypothetical protein [Paenibacillus sp. UNC451MF]|uniref:hypothetical protein n=1 Tax=Paenibacillus sp. UNC451MF TaxID=1449063 RepID=UPI0012DF06A0|nr:hypothetical protein [Paenibacillus sp. UNC451MF]